jgi:hypothetical protein
MRPKRLIIRYKRTKIIPSWWPKEYITISDLRRNLTQYLKAGGMYVASHRRLYKITVEEL